MPLLFFAKQPKQPKQVMGDHMEFQDLPTYDDIPNIIFETRMIAEKTDINLPEPLHYYNAEHETFFLWSGVYGTPCSMMTTDGVYDYKMTEVDSFLIEKPPFEFSSREEKQRWFEERCDKG
jgi:hypothetical protein